MISWFGVKSRSATCWLAATFCRGILGLSLCVCAVQGQSATISLAASPTRSDAGTPPTSGRDPGVQVERDWLDNRWSRTDVGQFLASNLRVGQSRIMKALSIKVGEHNEGTVCFDSGQCAIRAGWTGGFLQFDPARFGLVNSPRIAGNLTFAAPAGPGWLGASTRYSGLHVQGQRVVLEYTVNAMRVLDSPWLETRADLMVFTRSLELAPFSEPTQLVLAAGGDDVTVSSTGAHPQAVIGRDREVVALAVVGANVQLSKTNGRLIAHFPAHAQPLRVKLLVWAGDKARLPQFEAMTGTIMETEEIEALLKPGPARWLPELKTTGQRGFDTDILAVDTLTLPYDNPWNALLFLAGVDFTPDGAAYVCSIHGDVWRVTGIDASMRDLRWKRFATGLFQPLGLKVREGQVFVLGRDQITRLHDFNGDGEADFYENFCNLIKTAEGHSYVTSLEKDAQGNFYFVDPDGAHRILPDGRRMETLATGFRNPNGLGASPDGKVITVGPQQGTWTPSSLLCEIKSGGYYGFGGPRFKPERPLGYDPPLCWIPHRVDNSSGSQVWVPRDSWGALGGQMLHLLWGRCGLMLVLRDVVNGTSQGAVVPLPGRFLSGPQRGSFHPRDGQLYVAASTGWQTSAVKDGALHRVRLTDKPVHLPIAWHAHVNGLTIEFTGPLDRAAAEDIGSYAIHQWNYRYSSEYGSKDWSAADPGKEGVDDVPVKSARLFPDGRTVFLEMPDLRPVMQMEIKYNLNSAEGHPMRSQLWLTLNHLDAARR